jgi:hypothetical protein
MNPQSHRSDEPRHGLATWLAVIVLAFGLSRLILYKLGIRFDGTPLDWYPQYVDPALLRQHLLESTYYLHSQPPLFNLFIGAVVKLFPGHEVAAFAATYKGLGLVLCVSLFLVMRDLGVRTWIAGPLTVAFLLSPPCILFESWLFYAYPLATILILAALALHRYMISQRLFHALLFFSLLAMVVCMRSLFHLVWFLMLALMLLLCQRLQWRRVVLALLAPLAVVSFLYAKNLVLFGSFASSTWLGMSFGKMTTFKLPEEERQALVDEGKISRLGLIRPFSSIDVYKEYVPMPDKTGIPVLDQEKKTKGHPKYNSNYNNLIFVDISKLYLRDALWVLWNRPGTYLRTVALALGIYFFPANEYVFFQGNRQQMLAWDDFYNKVLYGQLLPHERRGWKSGYVTRHDLMRLSGIGFFLIAGFVTFIICGWRLLRKGLSGGVWDPGFRPTLLFIYLNVLYVSVVANLVEIGENNRFRFIIDPLILAGLGLCLDRIQRKIAGHLAGRRAGHR